MKVFFDESGQTGSIIPNKNRNLYGKNQKYFILSGLIVKNKDVEEILTKKYLDFKDKFNLTGEFKGTNLLKEENYKILDYFINYMLPSGSDNISPYYISINDKDFYITTLITLYLFPKTLRVDSPDIFYSHCDRLFMEDSEILTTYCDCLKENTPKKFVEYIANYKFKKLANDETNLYKKFAQSLLVDYKDDTDFYPFQLSYSSYIKKGVVNLLNLTALGESILFLNNWIQSPSSPIEIIHDRIPEFEIDFLDTLKEFPYINLYFKDSKNELLLQYTDNIASIYKRLFSHAIECFEKKTLWNVENEYMLQLSHKLLAKCPLKLVLPTFYQPLFSLIAEMFSPNYPKQKRTDIEFYLRYNMMLKDNNKKISELNFKNLTF